MTYLLDNTWCRHSAIGDHEEHAAIFEAIQRRDSEETPKRMRLQQTVGQMKVRAFWGSLTVLILPPG